ncbi:hypothetical protein N780_13490 [Pontibacillus chungwhensis BH030062]|uniref:Uncharacterized protein n=1 Tax=Pontibacillus chungwhensis BH030062 TaxID=1385513 RepID=A0A0A2V116_9BACI|nr:hypothetical protein [Pontibacillus chungwhensis]KGP92733.1 hypothetical protein N780_13490 [Pontibacillus chungwhensis BH030062]
MKQSTKWMSISAIAATIAITPVHATTVDAAEVSIENLSFSYDGQDLYKSYNDFSRALITKSGGMYKFVSEQDPVIQSIGLGDGTYVDYTKFAKQVITTSKDPLTILEELSQDPESTVPSSDVSNYEEITGFDPEGVPYTGEAVVPVVTDIY